MFIKTACCLLSLLSIASGVCVRFRVVSGCPGNVTDLSQVNGVRDPRACSVECAVRPNCTAVFKRDGTCYLATAAQYEALWRPLDCRSEVVEGRLVNTTSPPNSGADMSTTTSSVCFTDGQACTIDFMRDCSSDVHYLRCNHGAYVQMPCSAGTSYSLAHPIPLAPVHEDAHH
uniref:Apple domain-containing protein n=1 Tax=Macrostomum lignano TaxID=282301 RepID=A0A1I8GKV4_9PLAT